MRCRDFLFQKIGRKEDEKVFTAGAKEEEETGPSSLQKSQTASSQEKK